MASSSGSLAVKVFTSVPMSRFSSTFKSCCGQRGGLVYIRDLYFDHPRGALCPTVSTASGGARHTVIRDGHGEGEATRLGAGCVNRLFRGCLEATRIHEDTSDVSIAKISP